MPTSTYNVFVYKTDVASSREADTILHTIRKQYPNHIVFFDLLQADRILWVEGWNTIDTDVVEALLRLGYACEILKD